MISGPIDMRELECMSELLRKARTTRLQLYIDPDMCIFCAGCEPACPVKAIFDEDAVPKPWQRYMKRNADFFCSARRTDRGAA